MVATCYRVLHSTLAVQKHLVKIFTCSPNPFLLQILSLKAESNF